jgi:sigma-B regulation protein RsbU (phosphoserine phosphatase)
VFGPWEVRGLVIPAHAVGGDYFDYYALSSDRFAVAIADVSGKGMPAALLMSNVQAALRAHATGLRPASEVMRSVNTQVARTASQGRFVTMFYGEVDVSRGTLSYVSAGHNPPLLRRAGGHVEELGEGGLLLGVIEQTDYQQGLAAFAPGDALLLYSDGVSEATDSRGQQFGEDRLLQLWRDWSHAAPAEVLERLVKAIQDFRGSASQSDDITAVVVGTRPDP